MLFSSLIFIFTFLPLLLFVYYISPKNWRNNILLFFSIVFYAWGGVSSTIILILSIIINFLFVKQIERNNQNKRKWLLSGLIFNIVVIIVFKYVDFLIDNINSIGLVFITDFQGLPYAKIALPLGISFFTFQQMSLLWDVYRNPKTEKTIFSEVALYISLFPQLVAGPIVRYDDIVDEFKNRKESIDLFYSGIKRFIIGLFKKIIIANSCGEIADLILDSPSYHISPLIAWLGIISYAFQIFYDFSGYSDMAIGLGRMFGFNLLENFNFPYISRSIQEFWRRWHISLSTWFRDYVYIPLGGNRNGPYKTYSNLLIVFLLTGFWHGATWSFVIWGLFHGLFLIIERLGFNKILERLPKVISWSYTIIIVLISWVLFRIENLSDALIYISKLFDFGTPSDVDIMSYLNNERILILLLAVLFSLPIVNWIKSFFKKPHPTLLISYQVGLQAILIVMFFFTIIYTNSSSYNPFIYFKF